MTSPYRLRHRRPRGAHGRPSRFPAPSDILLAALSLALLLASAFAAGGLMARPF